MPPKLNIDATAHSPTIGLILHYGQILYNAWAGDAVQLSASVVGTLLIGYVVAQLGLSVWSFIRPSKIQGYCHSETGSWALVTGASDGIGRAFVDELLDRGFNVLLHGRNPEKLERIQKELAQKYPRRNIHFVVADASRSDHPETAVIEKVQQLPGKLTVLVNNVGGIPTTPTLLELRKTEAAAIDAQINVNARFPTQLIAALLPTLRQNQPSLILNCGSGGGIIGAPFIATYVATKAYIHTLTLALKAEMAAEGYAPDKKYISGVEVQGFIIGNTRSAGNKAEMPFFTISAAECAKGCLAKVGSGKALELPHWRQALQMGIASLVPEKYMRGFLASEMKKRKMEQDKEQ